MAKNELIPLCNAPLFVMTQVEGLLPLVSRLAPANTSGCTDGDEDSFTARGWRGAAIARQVAEDAFQELEPLSGSYATPTPDHGRLAELLYHAARVMAVASAALAGLNEERPRPHPTVVAWGLEDILERLQEDAEAAREVERSVFDYDRKGLVCNTCGTHHRSLRVGDDCPEEGCTGAVYFDVPEREVAHV